MEIKKFIETFVEGWGSFLKNTNVAGSFYNAKNIFWMNNIGLMAENIVKNNILESWQETYFEIVDFITRERMKTVLTGVIAKVQDKEGTCGFYQLAKDWTDEFEKKHFGREWDGEFFEEVENFCINKNKSLC